MLRKPNWSNGTSSYFSISSLSRLKITLWINVYITSELRQSVNWILSQRLNIYPIANASCSGYVKFSEWWYLNVFSFSVDSRPCYHRSATNLLIDARLNSLFSLKSSWFIALSFVLSWKGRVNCQFIFFCNHKKGCISKTSGAVRFM